jgi:hypothetical protein
LASISGLNRNDRISETIHRMIIVAVVLVANVITVATLILLYSFS